MESSQKKALKIFGIRRVKLPISMDRFPVQGKSRSSINPIHWESTH